MDGASLHRKAAGMRGFKIVILERVLPGCLGDDGSVKPEGHP